MELEHLRLAAELIRHHDHRELEEIVPPEIPETVVFEPNKAYVRQLLDAQMDLTTLGAGYVREAPRGSAHTATDPRRRDAAQGAGDR